jgi:hypothetical protein
MKQFKLVGSYSPVDRGVNGGKCRSESTRLIFIKHMHYCSIDDCDELNAGELPIGTFGAVTQTQEGSAVIIKEEEKTIHLPVGSWVTCMLFDFVSMMFFTQMSVKLLTSGTAVKKLQTRSPWWPVFCFMTPHKVK